jgi:hypothetical protein
MSSQPERSPYKGTAKKLLVAIDIGTTFSALSFSILQPKEVPQFNEVGLLYLPLTSLVFTIVI